MATQGDINDDIFKRLDAQDLVTRDMSKDVATIKADVAYMRGLMDGQKDTPAILMNKQNAITVAIAGLITTIGTVIASVFAGK